MAKQVIRLTESELKRFISEAVKRSLSEDWEADYNSEWGIGYPHSEIGHTVRNDRLSTSNPEIRGEYDKFKQHRSEISNAIRRRNEKMKK